MENQLLSDKNKQFSELDQIYQDLETKIKVIHNPEYEELVNFSKNLNIPRHRWFNIKEGFSAEIIKKLFNRFNGKPNDIIFDPFSGSGTTLLVAKELNVESFGFEINPFLAFLIKNKLFNKKINLTKYLKNIRDLKIESGLTYPTLSISQKLFGNQIDEVLSIKKYIDQIKDNEEKNLLKTAFICALEKSSTSKKDGNGLKYPKNKKRIQFKDAILEKITEINFDINNFILGDAESKVFNADVRMLKDLLQKPEINKYFNNVTLSIFSPPYMNCFDYTEVYKMELWFGEFIRDYPDLKILRENSLSSHLNKSFVNKDTTGDEYVIFFVDHLAKKMLWSKKIHLMIQGYFNDMHKTLQGIYELLKKGGVCIIVVGNSSYGNITIPTDLLLGKLGLGIGFKECTIEVARHLGTSSQQYKMINNTSLLRESLVILKK